MSFGEGNLHEENEKLRVLNAILRGEANEKDSRIRDLEAALDESTDAYLCLCREVGDLADTVRCRDCTWSRIHDGKSFPGKEYEGRMYCIAWSNGYEGEWTKPDGYCHKAKRKEDA